MALPWFRLYSEFVSDPKIQLLAFEDQRHFVALLCLKCNGTLDTASTNENHFERLICKALGLDPSSGTEVKRRLVEVGLIDHLWSPVAWERRQYESDSSTSRTRKWREKHREKHDGTSQERHSDAGVTDKNRTEQIQNRTEKQSPSAQPSPKEKPKRKTPKTQLPPDFEVTELMAAYAEKHLPQVDAPALEESFKGKALSKGWEYVNWTQAFQEFVRNCAPDSGHFAAGQYPKKKTGAPEPMLFEGQVVKW